MTTTKRRAGEVLDLPAEVCEALGFSPATRLVIEEDAPAPDTGVGHGATEMAASSLDEVIKAGFLARPQFNQARVRPLPHHAEHVEIKRWGANPGIVVFEHPGLRLTSYGEVRFEPGALVVDCRSADAYVRDPDGGWVAVCTRNHLIIGHVPHESEGDEPSAEMRRFPELPPQAPLEVTPPGVDELAAGVALPGWLRNQARDLLEIAAPRARIAGVGLLLRLWTPDNAGAVRERLSHDLLEGTGGPAPVVERWAARVDPAVWPRVERAALEEVDRLIGDLDVLKSTLVDRPGIAAASALAWIYRRDDLESIAAVLRLVASADLLHDALGRLDDAAAARHSIWSLCPRLDDERLRAVYWQEPEAWWGGLAAE
jgi:hypothetical protein